VSVQPSVAAKTERLLNLVIALLSTRMPLTKSRLRTAVPQYQQTASDEAFDRMFERDKDELRELGIPLVTTAVDPLFDDEQGYRIDRREYALPEISFSSDEVAALALAGRAWNQASLAGSAAAALAKLSSAGVALDDASLVGIEPRVRTREAAFEPIRRAVMNRQPVTFGYHKADGEGTTRHVQPWGLAWWRGRWYVTGFDVDRQAERVFRLGRIVGAVTTKGRAGSYQVPAGHEPRVLVRESEPGASDPADRPAAVVRVRAGAGNTLRRRAATAQDLTDGWSRLTVGYTDPHRFAEEVAGFGPDAVLESPEVVREHVVRLLRGALARHTGMPSAGAS
jgi:proteasome accessory factor B